MRVAVLGTGTMGAPMARRIADAGHDVRVWNRTAQRAERLGLEVARTPADAVAGAEVAITMLADGPAVEETMRAALPRMDGTVSVAFAESVGLDPRRFFETIDGAAFDMRYAQMKGELMLKREFPTAFALRLAQKDLRLAVEAAHDAGLELALAEQTVERMQRAVDAGHGDDDFAAVYLAAAPESK